MPRDRTEDKTLKELQLIKIVLLFCPTLRLFFISENVISAYEKNKKYNADKKKCSFGKCHEAGRDTEF